MGLFESIFKKAAAERDVHTFFKAFTAYQPVFTSYEGGYYEMALIRAVIHTRATHCAKLKPEVTGSARPDLKNVLAFRPNPFQNTYQFLYRLSTILDVHNTAFVTPLLDDNLEIVTGFYSLIPTQSEIVDYQSEPWLRYTFSTGQKASIPLSKVGILTQHQYQSDFFGESNQPLKTTMQLIHSQNQAIIEGAKNSASIRFLGRLTQSYTADTIEAERKRFIRDNLSSDNNGGIVLADVKYADLKQIESKPYLVNSAQTQSIKDNVYDYFGTNDKILHNEFTEDEWAAYYEGKIEPFALQLGLAMTNMTYSKGELNKNQIFFSSNRTQYASTSTKLSMSTQLFDRGLMTPNEARDVFNLPPRLTADGEKDPNGNLYYIRKEYSETNKLDAGVPDPTETPATPPTPTETPTEGGAQ